MKLFWFVLCALLTQTIDSSNLCLDYKIKDPRLQRQTIEHDAHCPCPCGQYPKTEGTNNRRRCLICGHPQIPADPTSKKGPQYKRFYNKGDRDFKPTGFKYKAKSVKKNLKKAL